MNILVDSREQRGLWEAGNHVEHGIEFTVERATLRTADYAIAGLEDLVLVERKASVDELAACVGYGRPRFERELRRMLDETVHRVLVIEATVEAVRSGPLSVQGDAAGDSRKPRQLVVEIRPGRDLGRLTGRSSRARAT